MKSTYKDDDKDELHEIPRTRQFDSDDNLLAAYNNQIANILNGAIQNNPLDNCKIKLPDGKKIGLDEAIKSTSINCKNPALDSVSVSENIKSAFSFGGGSYISQDVLSWYALQSFSGYQILSILSQHWLVDKACSVKGRDAIRNGFELKIDDGSEVDQEILSFITKRDKKFHLRKTLERADKFRNVHGIRHILFNIDGVDRSKPLNFDGIRPDSYRGMIQIEPYWISPGLSYDGFVDATSPDFYEPEYWIVQGETIHKSHFVILRGSEVSDVLKPAYHYGGLSLTQRIYERVYSAERTANEAPLLALTKRLYVHKLDLNTITGKAGEFIKKQNLAKKYQDNYGKLFIGDEEELNKLDTALSDFDTLIASQYHLVSSISNIPISKLFGEAPAGFQATGEFDMKNYHQELESIQADLSEVVEKHHMCLMKSEVIPKFSEDFDLCHEWYSPASLTELEKSTIAKEKSESAKTYVEIGAMDQYDIRNSIISDRFSGYTGIEEVERPEEEPDLDPLLIEIAQSRHTDPGNLTSNVKNDNSGQNNSADKRHVMDFVREENGKWYVFSESGKKLSKGYFSKKKADKRLKQIEYFKHHG